MRVYAWLACAVFLYHSCAIPQRTGYDRHIGGYKPPRSSLPAKLTAPRQDSAIANARIPDSAVIPVAATISRESLAGLSPLEQAINPWLGVPHRVGGQDKNGIDCSGFSQIIIRETQGIEIPRSSRGAWKTGTPVNRSDLRPGDVVFFGNAWGINHSGIWLGDGKFAHASTSRGVIITVLDEDPYWKKRYRGARRYTKD